MQPPAGDAEYAHDVQQHTTKTSNWLKTVPTLRRVAQDSVDSPHSLAIGRHACQAQIATTVSEAHLAQRS